MECFLSRGGTPQNEATLYQGKNQISGGHSVALAAGGQQQQLHGRHKYPLWSRYLPLV